MATIQVPVPAGFQFLPTVFSHGWYQLPPFRFDPATQVLSRVHQWRDGTVARLRLRGGGDAAPGMVQVDVEADGDGGRAGRFSRARRDELVNVVRTCLSLDHDLAPFYRQVRRRSGYGWIATLGAGRMLVAPTVWEDLAKTLLTTNTTWGATKQMCQRLSALGTPFGPEEFSFPTPERIAALSVDELNDQVRAGYRSESLSLLARAIVDGAIDPESWRGPGLSSDDRFRRIKALKGFGDYAAGSMCRLLGSFDRLGLDSSCRASFRARNGGEPAGDDQIALHYEPFGAWCGLALWMDVMKAHLIEHAGSAPARGIA